MKKMNDIDHASFILIIGSFLSILPNIPGFPAIDQMLPIEESASISVLGSKQQWINFFGTNISFGGSNVLPFNYIHGWTIFSLSGNLLWMIFITIGVIGITIGIFLKKKRLIFLVGIIGGTIETTLSLLIFFGNSRSYVNFGLSNLYNTQSISNFIGIGFWFIYLGSVLILVSGFIVLRYKVNIHKS